MPQGFVLGCQTANVPSNDAAACHKPLQVPSYRSGIPSANPDASAATTHEGAMAASAVSQDPRPAVLQPLWLAMCRMLAIVPHAPAHYLEAH